MCSEWGSSMLRLCTVDSCFGVTRERSAARKVQAAFRRGIVMREAERIQEMHRSTAEAHLVSEAIEESQRRKVRQTAEAHLIDEAVVESHRRQQDSQRRHTAGKAITTIQSHARRVKSQKEAEAAELAMLKGQGTRPRTQSFFPQTTTLHPASSLNGRGTLLL